MQQLYEVAVLTPFTTRSYPNIPKCSAHEVIKLEPAILSSHNTATHANFRHSSFIDLSRPPPNWNDIGPDTNTTLWSTGACNQNPGMFGKIDSQSQSSFSSFESLSSCGAGSSWSSGLLGSSESLRELMRPENILSSTAVTSRQTAFMDISFDSIPNVEGNVAGVNPQASTSANESKQESGLTSHPVLGSVPGTVLCTDLETVYERVPGTVPGTVCERVSERVPGTVLGTVYKRVPGSVTGSVTGHDVVDDAYLEQMIERAVEDLSALEVSTSQDKLRNQLTSSHHDLNSESHFSGRSVFNNTGISDVRQEFMSSDGTSEIEQQGCSAPYSGQVSRCSSLSSLFATSSRVCGENPADLKSSESVADQRCRTLKRKWTPQSVFGERAHTSLTNCQEKPNMGIIFSDDNNSTSSYTEIAATQPVLSNCEPSNLNPNSRPFIPKSHLMPPSQSGSTVSRPDTNIDTSSAWKSNVFIQACLQRSHFCDSGRGSTMDISSNITNARNDFSVDTSKIDYLCNGTPEELFQGGNDALIRKSLWEDLPPTHENVIRSEDLSPYDCKLGHGGEFTPIQDLNITKLPAEYQTWGSLETILSISQRVVKLRTRKPLKMARKENSLDKDKHQSSWTGYDTEDPMFDHYGTGFAFHADADSFVVRTHSEVVATSTEAANTEVMFEINIPGCRQNEWVHCMGQTEEFTSSVHSQTTTFTCRTPSQLLPFLHLFRNVPVVRRSSFFNDSCYFSDSSFNSSASDQDESPPGEKIHLSDEQFHGHFSNAEAGNNFSATSSVLHRNCGNDQIKRDDFLEPDTHLKQELPNVGNARTVGVKPQERNQSFSGNANSEESRLQDYDSNRPTNPEQSMSSATLFQKRTGDIPANQAIKQHLQKSNPNRLLYANVLRGKGPSQLSGQHLPGVDERSCPSADASKPALLPRKSLLTLFEDAQLPRPSNLPWLTSPTTNTGSMPALGAVAATVASPLVIMETKLQSSLGHPGGTPCPYEGQNIFGSRGQYQCFSSFAGDVMDDLVAFGLARGPSDTKSSQKNAQWEYEGLLFVQNHHRLAYINANKKSNEREVSVKEELPSIQRDISVEKQSISRIKSSHDLFPSSKSQAYNGESEVCRSADRIEDISSIAALSSQRSIQAAKCRSTEIPGSSSLQDKDETLPILVRNTFSGLTRNRLSEFSSRAAYIDTWDTDLLNLDNDLNPLPPFSHSQPPNNSRSQFDCKSESIDGTLQFSRIEAMIDRLLEDDDHDFDHPPCCSGNSFNIGASKSDFTLERKSSPCLLISYPHGGPKMLSTGLFSRHSIFGGVLYDTPTCMGSCGAPVIAFTQNVEMPYITQLVHSGSVKVNGVSVGAAESYFDNPLTNFP